MDEIGSGPSKPHRRHLLPAEALARAARISGETDLTRSHGQGNGVRIHGIYFAVVSVASLTLFIVAIALASTMR